MSIIMCKKGHCYDDEKFFQCPYCGVSFEFSQAEFGTNNGGVSVRLANMRDDDKTEIIENDD